MIEFRETGSNGTVRVFGVFENGGQKGSGSLRLCGGGRIEITIDCPGEINDFLFRSLLNVCAGYRDCYAAAANGVLLENLAQFGFRKNASGEYTVLTKDIKFPCKCKGGVS